MSRGMPVGFGSNRQIEESIDYRGSEKTLEKNTQYTHLYAVSASVCKVFQRGTPFYGRTVQ